MKKIFNLICILIVVVGIICLTGCNKERDNDKITIISTTFPGYDFARAITKGSDNIEVKMLLKPGAEMHHFEPTPKDIKNIKNSDMFIYIGGDSDEWVSDLLSDINTDKTKIIKMLDFVDLELEEHVEGMEGVEHEEEYDEHVWTSPINSITIIDQLKDEIIKLDSDNKELYEKNASTYISKLNNIDMEIKEIVKNAKRTEIIFGDRFPLRYFVLEYGLSYYAAFPGCSESVEASSKTIAFLINKVKEDKIPVIFHIELSDQKIAKAISKETGADVLEFHTAHNISQKDFDAGITIVDIMNKNVIALREALN